MQMKGSKTEKNLLASFAGESQARNRYTYFAGVAKKAGYEQIAGIFLETADNEKEHAKRFFKLLEGGEENEKGMSFREDEVPSPAQEAVEFSVYRFQVTNIPKNQRRHDEVK